MQIVEKTMSNYLSVLQLQMLRYKKKIVSLACSGLLNPPRLNVTAFSQTLSARWRHTGAFYGPTVLLRASRRQQQGPGK